VAVVGESTPTLPAGEILLLVPGLVELSLEVVDQLLIHSDKKPKKCSTHHHNCTFTTSHYYCRLLQVEPDHQCSPKYTIPSNHREENCPMVWGRMGKTVMVTLSILDK